MIGILLLGIGLTSSILIGIRIFRLMKWHSLIVDQLYEFYDGDSQYNLPSGVYVIDCDFGNHTISLSGEGGHALIGSKQGTVTYYGNKTREYQMDIKSELTGELTITGDTEGPFFNNNEFL